MHLKSLTTICGASVMAFVGPATDYLWLCTAMVAADFISARLLARRIKRRLGSIGNHERIKFSSRKFGSVLQTLAKTYALLLLAHGIDLTILGDSSPVCAIKFAASLVCFWQLWSILENEASANDASWARLAQKILVDKTERHLGIDLSELKTDQTHSAQKTS